jgi:splicing factor U2AF subunit
VAARSLLLLSRALSKPSTDAAVKSILADAGTDAQEITSRCMVMLNMVTPDELQDDEEYRDIMEDISEECGKYGTVEGIRIPRPVAKKQKKGWGAETISATEADQNRKIDEASGVGRVYVMYTDVAGAKTAMDALGGRQFGGRTILVASVSEVSAIWRKPGSAVLMAGRVHR